MNYVNKFEFDEDTVERGTALYDDLKCTYDNDPGALEVLTLILMEQALESEESLLYDELKEKVKWLNMLERVADVFYSYYTDD